MLTVVAIFPPAPPPTAAAELVSDVHYVATGEEHVRLEVTRDPALDPQPVVLVFSPYNTAMDGSDASGGFVGVSGRDVPDGFAVASADVPGTRGSTGCWDYGGRREQQAGVDVVNFLAALPWSNGNVGMIGNSYDGTTATMVAVRGDDAPALKAVVPSAAISRWYGYAYGKGLRYTSRGSAEGEVGNDGGGGTPLIFDAGWSRTVALDPTSGQARQAARDRAQPCDAVEHTQAGYDEQPDYDAFWTERDYVKDAGKVRASVLLVHGLQDYNVKPDHATDLWSAVPADDPATAALDGAPLKLLYLHQGAHAPPEADPDYRQLLDDFLTQTLKGDDRGLRSGAITQTRSGTTVSEPRLERAFPPAGTEPLRLSLARQGTSGVLTPGEAAEATAAFTDRLVAEPEALDAPESERSWLWYLSPPLEDDVRVAGRPELSLRLSSSRAAASLTPVLVDVAPSGSPYPVTRGFLDLRYRRSLRQAQPLPTGSPVDVDVDLMPQDYVFGEGHRIGLLVMASNVEWAKPLAPGAELTVHHGDASSLTLPAAPGG